jgi:hypothetical protein
LLQPSTKTEFNRVSLKAEPSTNSTFRGIIIDSSFDFENAFDSIRFNDDGDSNKTDESDSHLEKHDDPRISTEYGISTDSNFDLENAFVSIRFNDDGDSNEIDESNSQDAKHDDPRIVIKVGMII